MTLPDWLPHHCLHCGMYRGDDYSVFAECPDECNHSFEHGNTSGGQWQCPVCGESWMALPPDDWDGSLLYRPESEITPPPKYRADRLDESLLYAGTKWTREKVFG